MQQALRRLAGLTRARDLLGPPGRCSGWWVVMSAAAPAAFRFSGLLVVDSGATMELWRPGDDDVGFDGGGADRAQAGTGSSPTIGKSAAPTEGALAIARAGHRRPRH